MTASSAAPRAEAPVGTSGGTVSLAPADQAAVDSWQQTLRRHFNAAQEEDKK